MNLKHGSNIFPYAIREEKIKSWVKKAHFYEKEMRFSLKIAKLLVGSCILFWICLREESRLYRGFYAHSKKRKVHEFYEMRKKSGWSCQ